MWEKTAGILKLVDEIEFHPLNHKKVIFTQILFSDYKYCLIHFWSIEIELSGIKSGQENEFDSLGSQKIDFHVFGK